MFTGVHPLIITCTIRWIPDCSKLVDKWYSLQLMFLFTPLACYILKTRKRNGYLIYLLLKRNGYLIYLFLPCLLLFVCNETFIIKESIQNDNIINFTEVLWRLSLSPRNQNIDFLNKCFNWNNLFSKLNFFFCVTNYWYMSCCTDRNLMLKE